MCDLVLEPTEILLFIWIQGAAFETASGHAVWCTIQRLWLGPLHEPHGERGKLCTMSEEFVLGSLCPSNNVVCLVRLVRVENTDDTLSSQKSRLACGNVWLSIFTDSWTVTVLDMLELRGTTEYIDVLANKTSWVTCVLEDLKHWSTWDTVC